MIDEENAMQLDVANIDMLVIVTSEGYRSSQYDRSDGAARFKNQVP